MVNEWVMDAWKHVETDKRILDGFCQGGYFDLDGTIDKLHLKLCVTVKNLVKKVNSFIDEIISIGDNEVEANDDEEMDVNDFELRLKEI